MKTPGILSSKRTETGPWSDTFSYPPIQYLMFEIWRKWGRMSRLERGKSGFSIGVAHPPYTGRVWISEEGHTRVQVYTWGHVWCVFALLNADTLHFQVFPWELEEGRLVEKDGKKEIWSKRLKVGEEVGPGNGSTEWGEAAVPHRDQYVSGQQHFCQATLPATKPPNHLASSSQVAIKGSELQTLLEGGRGLRWVWRKARWGEDGRYTQVHLGQKQHPPQVPLHMHWVAHTTTTNTNIM